MNGNAEITGPRGARRQEGAEGADWLLMAAGLADGAGLLASPGAVLARVHAGGLDVLAAGPPDAVLGHAAASGARRLDFPKSILIPGLVNAHAHLDLTSVGARPYDLAGGFEAWLGMVIRSRPSDESALRASVREGAARSIGGGVVAIADIAGVGRVEPVEELRASDLVGSSFVEFFGVGGRQAEASRQVEELAARLVVEAEGVLAGISPHAPYSVGLRLYEAIQRIAERIGAPVCTHLAESLPERELVAHGRGPFRTLLEHIGLWDDAVLDEVGRGLHPIDHLATALRARPMLLAHLNDCPDNAIETVRASGASVAYCPRSWEYFGRHAEYGSHPYPALMKAGVNVALGTDSIINLPPSEAERITPLDDARLLHRKDGIDARTLLAMVTVNGARALGLDAGRFTFGPGPIAGIASVEVGGAGGDPAERVMESRSPARLIAIGKAGRARIVGAP